jgi:hypothetical protein
MKILHAREDLEVIVPDKSGPGYLVNFPAGTERCACA